jgi:hypothetical protein
MITKRNMIIRTNGMIIKYLRCSKKTALIKIKGIKTAPKIMQFEHKLLNLLFILSIS